MHRHGHPSMTGHSCVYQRIVEVVRVSISSLLCPHLALSTTAVWRKISIRKAIGAGCDTTKVSAGFVDGRKRFEAAEFLSQIDEKRRKNSLLVVTSSCYRSTSAGISFGKVAYIIGKWFVSQQSMMDWLLQVKLWVDESRGVDILSRFKFSIPLKMKIRSTSLASPTTSTWNKNCILRDSFHLVQSGPRYE